ncbi:MAG TPA: glycosyltransferase [Myxococcota bacterium]|nr:glycosyltransferase [Myxococcota bacterium]
MSATPGPVALVLGVWLGVAFAYRWFAMRSLSFLCDASRTPAELVPPDGEVVALRPLHGAPGGFASCQESLLRAVERAGVRVVFGVEERTDPAAAAATAIAARHPAARAEVRVARGPDGANRKVANLIQLSQGIDAELLLLTDADVRVPPDYVARMTPAFKDGEVGLVTGPYRSVPAQSIPSRLDALVTNTHFVPSTCVAARLEGVHFALGASIAVRSEALARGGGFAALLELAADDYGLAAQVERAGYRIAWAPLMVEHVLEDEGFTRALRRQLRWSRVVRGSRPLGYLGQIVALGAIPALALAALGGSGGALAPLAWWGAQLAHLWRRRALLALTPLDLALAPLADLLAVVIWAGGILGSPEPPESGDAGSLH